MNCLSCHKSITTMTWHNMFLIPGVKRICHLCDSKLEKVSSISKCERCNGSSEHKLCTDCINWDHSYDMNRPLIKNHSIYKYNSFLKDIISRWKYRGDYILADMFKSIVIKQFNKKFAQKKDALIVPIPLSDNRLQERGFNQATQLASFITSTISNVLIRTHAEKQAKKSRQERLSRENPFTCEVAIDLPVILIDDIYTTGATVYAAAETLKKCGCPSVYSLTLVRG